MLYIRGTNNRYRMADEQDVILEAIQIYNRNFSRGEALTSPDKAKNCIKLNWRRTSTKYFRVCSWTINIA